MTLINSRDSFIVCPESIRPRFDDPGLMRSATDERLVTLILADPPNSRNMEPQMTQKFIQISLDLLDHPVMDSLSDQQYRAVIKLLRKFTYAECKKDDHGQEIVLQRGQLMYTKRELAKQLNLAPTSLENLIAKLEKYQILGHKVGHIKSILTLCEPYIVKPLGQDSGQDWAKIGPQKNIDICNTSSSSKLDEPKKKAKKPATPKEPKPKAPKPEPTPEELELRKQRKITMDIAQQIGFPLAPAEINAQIKKYSLESVRFVINLFASDGFKNTKPEVLKGAIYKRIQTQHDYNEEFNENDRDPYAA